MSELRANDSASSHRPRDRIELRQIRGAGGNVRVVRHVKGGPDRECLSGDRLGFGKLAAQPMKFGDVVQDGRHGGVIGVEGVFVDCQRPAVEVLASARRPCIARIFPRLFDPAATLGWSGPRPFSRVSSGRRKPARHWRAGPPSE